MPMVDDIVQGQQDEQDQSLTGRVTRKARPGMERGLSQEDSKSLGAWITGLWGSSKPAEPAAPAPVAQAPAEPPAPPAADDKHKFATYLDNQVQSLDKRIGELGSSDQQFFSDKWADIKKEYEDAKSRYETAEVLNVFADALTKIAAGWYGMKTGTDMSGVKFDKQDWSKKVDQAREDLKVKLSALEEEGKLRTGQRKEAEAAKETALRLKAAMGEEEEKATLKKEAATAKAQTEEGKKFDTAVNNIQKIASNRAIKSSDKILQYKAELQQVMPEKSPEEIDKFVAEKSWPWGQNPRDISQITMDINSEKNKHVAALGNKTTSPRQLVKKQFNPARNQTKFIYSDGTEEIVDGQR